ncbi:hypothetical protein HD599_000442 [Conyzicola lurida]|uniref:Ig-like domain-containing protein n=1 Tax=Conyzicola lurida TaxID=1172621 RepID=A0A841AL00_9MICO|nr:Ig-like domain-containing protein [Conyzicola lurida]MBB5842119.1 hypothetical protein [Conyzicola lurida]
MSTPSLGLGSRLRRSVAPAVLLRSVAGAVVAIVAMPVVAVLALWGLSGIAPTLASTGPGAIALGASSNVVLYGVSALGLVFGVLLVGFVNAHAQSETRRPLRLAFARALRAYPRLLLALLLGGIGVVAGILLWPFITVAMVVVSVVLLARARRFTPAARRALLWAIPFAPVAALIALVVAAFPTILSAPRSLRELLGLARTQVRSGYRSLIVFALIALAAGVGLSFGGAFAAAAVDPSNSEEITGAYLASIGVLGLALVLLQLIVGTAMATVMMDAAPPAPARGARASLRSIGALMSRGSRPAVGRTAMVVVLALVATLAPMPAFAQTPPVVTPAVPQLDLTVDGIDASPLVTAAVTVVDASPAGTVQFVDGETPLGTPMTLAVDPADASRFTAVLDPLPVLAEGSHEISFVFTPADATVYSAQSAPKTYVVGSTPVAVAVEPAVEEPVVEPAPAAEVTGPETAAGIPAPAVETAVPAEDVPATETPAAEADLPAAEADVPPAVTDVPAAVTDAPTAETEIPPAVTDAPAEETELPAAEAEAPAADASAPEAEENVPGSPADVPAAQSPAAEIPAAEVAVPADAVPVPAAEDESPATDSSPVETPSITAPFARVAAADDFTFVTAEIKTFTLGSDFEVSVQVRAPYGDDDADAPGRVSVYADGVLFAEIDQTPTGEYVGLSTATLAAVPAEVQFVYEGEPGFLPSQLTMPVNPALPISQTYFTNHTFFPTDYDMTWGDTNTVTVTVVSDYDEPRVLEVLQLVNGYDLVPLFSVPFTIVDGTAVVTADLTKKLPGGEPTYTLRVPATDIASEAGTDYFTKRIAAVATTTTLAATDAAGAPTAGAVGQPITLTAAVASPASDSTPTGGFVRFTINGLLGAPVAVDAQGIATTTYTPTTRATVAVTADYLPDNRFAAYLASSDALSLNPGGIATQAPTAVWSGALTVSDTRLTVTYPTGDGIASPTGTVTILDAAGTPVRISIAGGAAQTSFALYGGTTTLPIPSAGGILNYSVSYSGDTIYSPRTDRLPPVTVLPPTVALTAPAPAYFTERTPFTVAVGNVDAALVHDVTIYATLQGGAPHSLGTVRINSAGVGTTTAVFPESGDVTVTAVVRFTATSGIAAATSVPQIVIVPEPAAPTVSLELASSTIFGVGRRDIGLRVAVDFGREPASITGGAVAVIRDELGVKVGSVTLDSRLGGWGIVSLSRASTTSLTATVVYGDDGETASSTPMIVSVPPRTTSTTVSSTQSPTTAGNTVSIEVAAEVSGTPLDSTASIPVTVELNGETQTLELARTEEERDYGWLGSTAFLEGTAEFAIADAGAYTLHVTGDGNGTDVSPIDYRRTITIDRHTSAIVVRGTDAVVGGKPFSLTPVVSATDAGGRAPTGTVAVTLYPSFQRCEVAVGASCDFPAGAAVSGTNSFAVSYSGDADHLPRATSGEFSAAARTTAMTTGFGTATDKWVVGERVTANWVVTTSGTAARGWVYVTAGNQRCGAAVADGHCDFTVPENSLSFEDAGQTYTFEFVSGDDAPSKKVSGSAVWRDCVFVYAYVPVDVSAAEPCVARGQKGVFPGSTVSLTTNLIPDNYVFDGWTLNNKPVTGTKTVGRTTSFVVKSGGMFTYDTKWAPVCFTLTVSPNNVATRSEAKGSITVLNQPNCASPFGPTAEELKELAAGKPRYAKGTVVDVRADPQTYNPAGNQPFLQYTVVSFDGVVPEPAYRDFGRVTMNGDRAISAVFAVPDCSPFTLLQTRGGTASVVSSARPASSGALKPATGACTTPDGRAGYVPGTKVVVESVPDSGAVFDKLVTAGAFPAVRDTFPRVTTTPQKTGEPVRTSVEIGLRAATVAWSTFSYRDCVTVVVRDTSPAQSSSGARLAALDPAQMCAAPKTSAVTTESTWQSTYRTWTTTYSVLSNATVRAVADYPAASGIKLSYLSWSVRVGATTLKSADRMNFMDAYQGGIHPALNYVGQDGEKEGPYIDLALLGPSERVVYVDGVIGAYNCTKPYVENPFGVAYGQRALYSTMQKCKEDGFVLPSDQVELRAAKPTSGSLTPVWSLSGGSSNDGRYYYPGSTIQVAGNSRVALEYCANLPLTVRQRDDSGTFSVLNASQAAALIMDTGGCAPMRTRPGGTVQTGLTVAAAYQYSLVNPAAGMPKFVVDGAGNSAAATLDIAVNCVTVNTGDRTRAETPANCPGGGSNRYLKGTVIQFNGDVRDDEGLEGWTGVDEQNGVTAWVMAETDRWVEVDIDYPSFWEKVGNAFSNLAGRIVSVAVTIATGIVLAKAMLVKMASSALKGIGAIVMIAGGGDGMLNAMTKFDNGVSAMINSAQLLSTCLNTSARGPGNLTDLPSGALGSVGVVAVNGGISATNAGLAKYGELASKTQGMSSALGDAATVLSYGRTLVDGFGSNVNMYSRDATEVWTTMGNDLGGCMSSGLESNFKLATS